MKLLFRVLIIFGLLFGQQAFSAEVKGLFETEVVAKSQATVDRDSAIRDAMTVVLKRILAGDDVLKDPAVQTALDKSLFYTKQFQYSLVEDASASGGSARTMRVLFNEETILDLLSSGKLGIWSEIRPETLVWLVVEQEGKRRFFKPEAMPDLDFALSQAAKQKGLPIIFPLLDLEERELISINDVLSAYPDQLLDISSRYDVVSILAGRLVNKNNCWQAEWAFYFDQGVKQWMQPCQILAQTLLGGMEGAYNNLAAFYSVKPNVAEKGTVTLNITGITGMTDLSRVNKYLKSLTMVKSVTWISADGGVNRYKINYERDRAVFENILALGRVLEPLHENILELDEINYRLLPNYKNH